MYMYTYTYIYIYITIYDIHIKRAARERPPKAVCLF